MEAGNLEQGFKTLEKSRDTCSNLLNQWLDDLQDLWMEVGIQPEHQITRIKVVYDNLSELMRAMIKEESSRRDGYIENIEKCRSECMRLAEELETTFKEPDQNLSILKKEKILRDEVKQLLKERQLRLREAINLRTQEGELCARLGRIPEYIQSDTVLSKDQVKEATTRIGFLTAEKNKREIKLAIAAKDILQFWTELNVRSKNEREEQIETGSLDSFQLSNENMSWLEQMKQSLTAHLEDNTKLRRTLITKLESLWTRMELPVETQKQFLEQHFGHSDHVIVKIKEEVNKMEDLKLENLGQFIKLTRAEVDKYWELMFYSEDDKKLFAPYYSETVGENVLQQHEKKLETLLEEYNNYESLYQTIKSRNVMWKKWEELECQEQDPNRFDNRGGKLLKEEKARKKMARDLPKMEESAFKEIEAWERDTDRIFTVYGHKFSDYINQQKEELQQRKEELKENKLKAKEEAIQIEHTYGSTPARTPKRRIAGTTILTPATKRTKTGNGSTPAPTTPTRSTRTPKSRHFVHSSLVVKSPMKTPNREKNFPRVIVKVPTEKRADTPIKRPRFVEEDIVPEGGLVMAPAEASADSGITSNLDFENQVSDYAEFANEVNDPSRELMRSSSVHVPSPENVRRSLLNTIQESE